MNKLNEGYQDLQNPDYPLYIDNPFNGEEVNNYAYGEDWYQEPKSNGIPYYMLKSNLVDPQNVVLPEQLINTNKKYDIGIINFDKSFDEKVNSKNVDRFINKNNLKSLNKNILTGESLTKKEMTLFLYKQNSKTWINRWKEYNPNIDFNFKNKYIKSDIKDVNRINRVVLDKINIAQTKLLNNDKLLNLGARNYNLLIYKVSKIETSNSIIIYTIRIVLYRDNLKFAPYFYFKGFVVNNRVYIFDFDFVGYFLTEMLLETNGVEIGNQKLYTTYNLNKNFRYYEPKINDDLLKTVYARDKYLDSYKLKNQYTCFSLNLNTYVNPTIDARVILPYNTKEDCQSRFDSYGKVKTPGIWDTPCKNNEDCHFYKKNKNYPNSRGKCGNNGYCELPKGMLHLGYHYFNNIPQKKPLCYNCKSKDKWYAVTDLGNCCYEQSDKKKYPFLDSPDFAFENDLNERINYFNSKNCYIDSNNKTICNY